MTYNDIIKHLKVAYGDPKYSVNLRQWIKRKCISGVPIIRAFQSSKNGEVYLGTLTADGAILGNRVKSIICGLNKRTTFCYHPLDAEVFTEIPDFWQAYFKKGICYLDPMHINYGFIRWDVKGKTRTCKCCGLVQKQKRRVVREVYYHWATVK